MINANIRSEIHNKGGEYVGSNVVIDETATDDEISVIIDLLEMIQVDRYLTKRRGLATTAYEFVLGGFQKATAVGAAGEAVGSGLSLQFFFQLMQGGDVGTHADHRWRP